jgi:hypothetical protein
MAKKLVVVTEVVCDGSATALTAASIGMERIEAAHAQNIDDTAQAVIGTYEGTSITINGTSSKKHLLFCYGY